jgi:multiple antibiotic resistance protein
MDPLGIAPIFLALTASRSASARRLAAVQAAAAAGGLVLLFALAGNFVLGYLHVSVQSLSIAGGLLLLLVALEMVHRGAPEPPDAGTNVVLVPLATPLLAGPGAIAAVLVLIQRYPSLDGRLGVIAGVIAVSFAIALVLLAGNLIANRLLRPSAIQFLSRVLGLLLAAIAVQLIIDAVRELVRAA